MFMLLLGATVAQSYGINTHVKNGLISAVAGAAAVAVLWGGQTYLIDDEKDQQSFFDWLKSNPGKAAAAFFTVGGGTMAFLERGTIKWLNKTQETSSLQDSVPEKKEPIAPPPPITEQLPLFKQMDEHRYIPAFGGYDEKIISTLTVSSGNPEIQKIMQTLDLEETGNDNIYPINNKTLVDALKGIGIPNVKESCDNAPQELSILSPSDYAIFCRNH